jgi:hypothetical protein
MQGIAFALVSCPYAHRCAAAGAALALGEMQLATVDLGKKRDQSRGRLSFNGHYADRLGEQFVIREGDD